MGEYDLKAGKAALAFSRGFPDLRFLVHSTVEVFPFHEKVKMTFYIPGKGSLVIDEVLQGTQATTTLQQDPKIIHRKTLERPSICKNVFDIKNFFSCAVCLILMIEQMFFVELLCVFFSFVAYSNQKKAKKQGIAHFHSIKIEK